MGGTKSKVEDTPDEESDESSQTSESTYRNTEFTRHHHEQRRHRQRSPNRKKRQSDISTPSPDEILDKPFTYRSRKDRLLESLNAGAGDRCEYSTDECDSYEKAKNGKISVQKIVENIQANLNAKSGSSSSTNKDDCQKPSKNLNRSNDSNSLININKKSHRRKSSSKVVSSTKEVKPTGVEEKIIESLIQPRKRQRSLPRSVKIKDSTQCVNVLSNPVAVSFNNEVSRSIAPKPPEPPPIDFSEGSASDQESQKANKKISTLTSNIQGKDLKPFDSILPGTVPSHLKELKLRFSNDVPRSPHEDNLNSTSITEKTPTKQLEKPLNGRESAPSKSYFTNDVPVADSLHILTHKPGSPKVVIRGAKDQDKRSNEHRSKHRKSQGEESNQDSHLTLDNASETSRRKAGQGNHSRPASAGPKSILKSNQDDDVIKCFPVKAEYNEETKDLAKQKMASSDRRERERDKSKNSNANCCKTARTQTSCLGLVDSGVQTLPDLELQGHRIRKDGDVDYEASIDNNARKVLRRVSMDKSVDRKTSKDHKRGRRYRNGSTQWEEVDLLDISSCSMLNRKGPYAPKERPQSSKSKSRTKIRENKQVPRCNESRDCQDCLNRNEVCCMHLQVIPGPSMVKRSTRRESRLSKKSDLLDKQEPKGRITLGEDSNYCEGCSRSGLSSSEKLSAWATYSTSSGRSRELSLLSPFRSTSTVRSKNKPKMSHRMKNEDVYRQMEELGLGFLRDGEWAQFSETKNWTSLQLEGPIHLPWSLDANADNAIILAYLTQSRSQLESDEGRDVNRLTPLGV